MKMTNIRQLCLFKLFFLQSLTSFGSLTHDLLPDLTAFDEVSHEFHSLYRGVLKGQSQQHRPFASLL